MMSDSKEVKFSLKIVINKEKNMVLFAEVESDFADVLLSFMTLPLGTIVRLLAKHFGDEAPTIGSLNTLYQGLSNLESSHFCTDTAKQILLNARNSLAFLCQKLKLNLDDSEPTKYFICSNCGYNRTCARYIIMNSDGSICKCGGSLKCQKNLESSCIETGSSDGGVFTKETVTFIISDDLQVVPKSLGSCIQFLNNFGIRDTDGLEERTVTFGFIEIMNLLKASLLSKTPLTDIIFHKCKKVSANVMSELCWSLPPIGENVSTKKMIVKAIIKKSTKKVVLAQAEQDFIDFLFSLLTIPLGRVICLLGSDTCLGSVDNLYRSITKLDAERHLKTKDLKTSLLKPELPPEYLSKNQIFSHTEDITLVIPKTRYGLHFLDLNGKSGYVKGPAMFMVTDDLVVTPFPAISSLAFLNSFKIPVAEVEECQFEIGMEEALDLLKASLTSASALTDVGKHILKRLLETPL